MKRRRIFVILVNAAALALSCSRAATSTSGPGGPAAGGASGTPETQVGSGSQKRVMYELNPGRSLDLVFVIDNSDAMAEEQANLARALPRLLEGTNTDLRVAVVSSNFGAGPNVVSPACPIYGDQGRFLVKPGCGLDENNSHWLEHDARTGKQNFTGDLATVLACMTTLGTGGCGYEHQLQALRSSLYDVNPENRGFLRPDAYLGIIILSDEDDCSAEPYATFFDQPVPSGQATSLICANLGHVCNGQDVPAMSGFSAPLSSCVPYERKQDPNLDLRPQMDPARQARLINVSQLVDYIKAKKPGRPDRIFVSAIVGWPAPDQVEGAAYQVDMVMKDKPAPRTELDNVPICQSAVTGRATAGIRLKTFVDGFAPNGSLYSICQDDYNATMTSIGQQLRARLEDQCVPAGLADADPDQRGLQPDCAVEVLTPAAGGLYQRAPLPRCRPDGTRPCWTVDDALGCSSQVRFVLDAGSEPPPLNALLSYSCREDATPMPPLCGASCPGPVDKAPLGQACDLGLASPPGTNQSVWRGDAAECPSRLCLKIASSPSVATSPNTAATCTAACSSDADCAGADVRSPGAVGDKRCAKGYTCRVDFEVGPLACRKLCLCRDFLPAGPVYEPASCGKPG